MADLNKIIEAVNDKTDEVAYKVKNFNVEQFLEEVRGLDTGVAYTKFMDAIAALDVEGKKQAVRDLMDSPQMDALKEKVRMVGDFMGYVPYYAQSVPEMIREAFQKK